MLFGNLEEQLFNEFQNSKLLYGDLAMDISTVNLQPEFGSLGMEISTVNLQPEFRKCFLEIYVNNCVFKSGQSKKIKVVITHPQPEKKSSAEFFTNNVVFLSLFEV